MSTKALERVCTFMCVYVAQNILKYTNDILLKFETCLKIIINVYLLKKKKKKEIAT